MKEPLFSNWSRTAKETSCVYPQGRDYYVSSFSLWVTEMYESPWCQVGKEYLDGNQWVQIIHYANRLAVCFHTFSSVE